MPFIIGILLDVSGSMRDCIDKKYNQQGGSWSRSIIKVLDEMVKEDLPKDTVVFAAAFGARQNPVTFDFLNTVEKGLKIKAQHDRDMGKYKYMSTPNIIEQALKILEKNGADCIRNWAKFSDLVETIEHEQAKMILFKLENSQDFRHRFVHDCLPEQCRSQFGSFKMMGSEAARKTSGLWGVFMPERKEKFEGATKEEISKAVRKGMGLIGDKKSIDLVGFGTNSLLGVNKAHRILHECTTK